MKQADNIWKAKQQQYGKVQTKQLVDVHKQIQTSECGLLTSRQDTGTVSDETELTYSIGYQKKIPAWICASAYKRGGSIFQSLTLSIETKLSA